MRERPKIIYSKFLGDSQEIKNTTSNSS